MAADEAIRRCVMIKPVEPLLKIDTVLDYAAPTAPKSKLEMLEDEFDRLSDFVGGRGAALAIITTAFFFIGISIPGPIGATLVLIAGLFLRSLLNHWVHSSRW